MDSKDGEACEPVADGMVGEAGVEGRSDLEINAAWMNRVEQLQAYYGFRHTMSEVSGKCKCTSSTGDFCYDGSELPPLQNVLRLQKPACCQAQCPENISVRPCLSKREVA